MCIQDLQNNDLENRSRRYSFCTCGLPESITYLDTAIKPFLKEMIPDILEHCLEVDQAQGPDICKF